MEPTGTRCLRLPVAIGVSQCKIGRAFSSVGVTSTEPQKDAIGGILAPSLLACGPSKPGLGAEHIVADARSAIVVLAVGRALGFSVLVIGDAPVHADSQAGNW